MWSSVNFFQDVALPMCCAECNNAVFWLHVTCCSCEAQFYLSAYPVFFNMAGAFLDGGSTGAAISAIPEELFVVGAGNDQCNGCYKKNGTSMSLHTKYKQENTKGGSPLEIWYDMSCWVLGATAEHYYAKEGSPFGKWRMSTHMVASTSRDPPPMVYPASVMQTCMIWCGCGK